MFKENLMHSARIRSYCGINTQKGTRETWLVCKLPVWVVWRIFCDNSFIFYWLIFFFFVRGFYQLLQKSTANRFFCSLYALIQPSFTEGCLILVPKDINLFRKYLINWAFIRNIKKYRKNVQYSRNILQLNIQRENWIKMCISTK